MTREEFQALYRAQLTYVWSFLRRLGVPERDLEDLAQEVFVAMYRSDFDARRPARPFLAGIAFRVASDYRRKASVKRERLEEPAEPPAVPPDALERLEAEEARNLVLLALDTMDLEQRAVFTLYEIEERKAKEIAEILSLPINTVYPRIRLAREKFEKAVRRQIARAS